MLSINHLPSLLRASVLKYIADRQETPAIIFNKELLIYNFHYLKNALGFACNDLYFSVKSNYCNEVIDVLKPLSAAFEIGSLCEMNLLKNKNIEPERIIFSNPVKIPEHIAAAAQYGIDIFCFDNDNELYKLAKYAPNAKVFVRLAINNEGASWKLTGKFGCDVNKACELMRKAQSLELCPVGITMHLGWNNNNKRTWADTLSTVERLVKECFENNIHLDFIDLGGGFPAHLNDQYEDLRLIADAVLPVLKQIKADYNIRIIAEPGSFLVANTAAMVVEIFDIVERDEKKWVFVNSGINQGFFWIYSGLQYGITTTKTHPEDETISCVITGPTCDTHDVFSEDVKLPENIEVGDCLIIYPAGAYINSSEAYNGFSMPDFICY